MIPRRIPLIALGACLCLLLAPLPAEAQAPLRVGNDVKIHIDSRGPSDIEATPTADGRLYRLTHDGATYIALHFAEFDLAPGDSVRISDAQGRQDYVLTGKGKMEAGTFWSQHVKGDTVLIEYFTQDDRQSLGGGFTIDKFAAGFVDLGPGGGSGGDYDPEAICGTDDKENAVCYQTSHPTEYERGRAVARLLINGGSLCTGWLASADNHLVTNEHCISNSSSALNTDYEFMSEAPDCGSGNCQLCWDGTVFSGATWIQESTNLDYALVQINSGDPASTYGFLVIDDRPAVIGEEIYILQHPGGRAKEFGINSSHSQDGGICQVNTFSNPCTGSGYQDVGYYCDTEGGSSGSPVLARSSHKVIALHHCANCPNRGVPIDLICDEICQFLSKPCTTTAECDDNDSCTTDACVAGFCENTAEVPCCGNGTCESGEDCNICNLDCVSGPQPGGCGNAVCEDGEDCLSCPQDCNGKQNGNPANRYCCSGTTGGSGGEGAVDCNDARCTGGGNTCGEVPDFCCGDGICDPGEDDVSCDLDCDAPDPGCTLGQKGDFCSIGTDCCSGRCKPNRRCQ